ncbi:hypothetical protein GCM10023093_28610 [Nemorincola caseinilytica]|uniref:DUF1573 domain-containing protein n=1 Tax=Nemorincola caseinilytica TaxID=2054315 RepID=A0ABP8NMG7_9BACT
MKRYLAFAMLALAACGGDTKQEQSNDKLPASLVSNPHSAAGIDTVAAAMKPVMKFSDTSHNFGTIHEGETVSHEFAFTNTGKTPLIISSASGSCGCTVPEYPKEPIAPGQAATLKVTFNSAGKGGHQEKSVTLITNTLQGRQMLFIQAEVEKKK